MARAPSPPPRLPVPGQDHHCHPAAPGGGQAAHHEGEVVAGQWVSRGGKQRGQRPGHPEDRGHLHRPSRRAGPVCAGGRGRVCVQAPQDRRARAGKPPRTGAGMGKERNRSGTTLASNSSGARCTVVSDPTSPQQPTLHPVHQEALPAPLCRLSHHAGSMPGHAHHPQLDHALASGRVFLPPPFLPTSCSPYNSQCPD